MNINIIGGNGVVGHGVTHRLASEHIVRSFGRESYNPEINEYVNPDIPKCDCLIHAAGVTDEEVVMSECNSLLRSVIATRKILSMAASEGCTHAVYVSSMHVYGQMQGIISETSPLNPVTIYGFCHLSAEWAFRRASIENGIKCLILRPGTVFGFPRHPSLINRVKLIPYDFPIQLVTHGNIRLVTPGFQYRNFCSNLDIGAVVRQWIAFSEHRCLITSNVVGYPTITVRKFAELCCAKYNALTGRHAEVIAPDGIRSEPFEPQSLMAIKRPQLLEEFVVDYLAYLLGRSA